MKNFLQNKMKEDINNNSSQQEDKKKEIFDEKEKRLRKIREKCEMKSVFKEI